MIRLIKGGMVRIVETDAEAERFIKQGYSPETSKTSAPTNAKLGEKTIAQLADFCVSKNISISAGAKKQDIISLILEKLPSEEWEEF